MSKTNIDNFLKHANGDICVHISDIQITPIDLKIAIEKLQTIMEPNSIIIDTMIRLEYKNNIIQSKIIGQTMNTFIENTKTIKIGSYSVSNTESKPMTGNVPDQALKVLVMKRFHNKLINNDGTLTITLKKELTNPLEFAKNIKSSIEDLSPSDLSDMSDNAYNSVSITFHTETITKQSVYEIVSLINSTMNVQNTDSEYQTELYELAKDIYRDPITISQFKYKSGFKRIGSSTIELSRPTFFKTILPNIDQYMITDKMDGLRAILIIEEMTSNKKVIGANIRAISDMIYTVQETGKSKKNILKTVLDVEMLPDQSFHCFDVIMYKSKRLSGVHFGMRKEYFTQVDEMLKLYSIGQVKEFQQLEKNTFCKQITDFYNKKRNYHIDGLIFTPLGQPFKKSNNRMDRQFNYSYPSTVSLKWKPKEQMTIDFYFMKMNDKYVLCSGVDMNTFKRFGMSLFEGYEAPNTPNADKYFPVQFESYDGTFDNIWKPTDEDKKMLITNDRIYDNFEGLVGEFQLSDEKSILAKPKLLKIRYDRIQDVAKGEYFGNAYRYAELIWHSIKNPLEIKTMCDAKIDSYFASDDNDEYSAQRAFNSFVKTNLIEKYLFSTMGKRSRILDAMAGKGQDLARVIDIGFTEIIAIDKDIDALYEMLERKYNLRVKRKNAEARVNIKQIDLENVPEDFKIDVDCAMINFGIHYLCHDNGLNDFVKLCTNSIKSGGRLLITALDGENVFQLLNTNPLWKLTENGKIKYSIQKKYSSKQFLPLNQTIGVLLPFSNGEMYDEYLVNFEYIETLFTEFKLVAYDNFQSLMKVAKKDNKHLYDKLTETDQKWVSMYSYMILEKK
jgi:SAM-dependent methyltransferase